MLRARHEHGLPRGVIARGQGAGRHLASRRVHPLGAPGRVDRDTARVAGWGSVQGLRLWRRRRHYGHIIRLALALAWLARFERKRVS